MLGAQRELRVVAILGTFWQELGQKVPFEGRMHFLTFLGLPEGSEQDSLPLRAALQIFEDNHTSFPGLPVHYLSHS